MWQTLKHRNHFEVLGLSRSVGETEVKEAYFRLAKRFHPDVHHGTSLGDLNDQLEAVFIRLGEAYDVLRDPRRRADYEQRLGRPRPGLPSAPAAQRVAEAASSTAAEKPTQTKTARAAADPEPRLPLAEDAIAQATKLFEGERYWDAIQLLEPVLHAAQGRLRSRGRLLLARCYLKNPKWARRAEETLNQVTRDDPQEAEAWALLGGIYEGKGMRARALSMYRKTLELKPDHESAARYVSAQPAEEPAAPEEGGGLFRKLFRKP
jgi:curved DNA-binding protein CbpA